MIDQLLDDGFSLVEFVQLAEGVLPNAMVLSICQRLSFVVPYSEIEAIEKSGAFRRLRG